jgi:hypothetical protein
MLQREVDRRRAAQRGADENRLLDGEELQQAVQIPPVGKRPRGQG